MNLRIQLVICFLLLSLETQIDNKITYFYPTANLYVRNLLDEASFRDCDLILSKREKVLNSEPNKFRIFGIKYTVHSFFFKSIMCDIASYFTYLYDKDKNLSYSNAFLSFLEYNTYSLSYETPENFLRKYGKFFDKYLTNFLKKKFDGCYNNEYIESNFTISSDIELQLNNNVAWNELKNAIQLIFSEKNKISLQLENNISTALS